MSLSVATTRGASNKRAPVLVAQGILVILILASYVMAAWGAMNSGVTWDEKYHVAQLERAIKPIPYTNLYGGEIQVRQVDRLDFVYGLAYQYLGHVANIARGNEQWGSPQTTAESYAVRHLVGVGLSVAAGVAVFVSVRLITGYTTASLFGWAALALWPTWLGHSFMNPKDFPAAVGWTIFSTGLVVLVQARSRSFQTLSIGILITAVGFALAMGTRIALWLPLGAIAIWMSVLLALRRRAFVRISPLTSPSGLSAFSPLVGVILGVLGFFILHPHLVTQLRGVFYESVAMSASYHQLAFVLTYGRVVVSPDEMQRWYLPLWFWAIAPVALISLIGIATLWFIGKLVWAPFNRSSVSTGFESVKIHGGLLALTPWVLQAFALVFASVVVNAPSYDAQRQHLYALPALAVLGATGIAICWQLSARFASSRNRTLGHGVVVLMSSSILLEYLLFNAQLVPYNYAYVTPGATIGRDANRTWETDYWGLSVREAVTSVPPTGRLSTWGASSSWEPFVHLRSGETTRDLQPNEFYWIKSQRNDFGVPTPGDCEQIDQIERTVLGKTFTMSRTYICQETNS